MLEINWTTHEPAPGSTDLLAVCVAEEPDPGEVEARFGTGVRKAVEASTFAGKRGETFSFSQEHDGALTHVVMFGTGADLENATDLRTLCHDVTRRGQSIGAKSITIDFRWSQGVDAPWNSDNATRMGNLVAQGCELGAYAYERFLSEDKRTPRTVKSVRIWAENTAPDEGTALGQGSAVAIGRARDLANGPAELVTPTFLAETAESIVSAAKGSADVSLKILDKAACEKQGMGCYLGVAKGSDEPLKFIHMTYKPKGECRGKVALIGKGVTFDSGGYSIKPTEGMLDMKLDMSGAAAVIGAFEGIVGLKLPWEVHVIVAATENMVSGHAYRLGDVLTASNGKTVEINNTDAEGRLTLADALVYASKLEPDFMVDFATLTGACMVALGPKIAGVMTKDENLAEDWLAAAQRCGEEMWRLPLPEDLKEQLKSKIADMKNTGERWGGALTAGLFLSEFHEGRRWLHVDIAGPAMASKAYGLTTPGGTGYPVATILEFLSGDVRL